MPDTLLSLGIAVAFVLPGFVMADLAESRRATRAARSDLELVLRGLLYAVVLQALVALTGWTEEVVDDVERSGWQSHIVELTLFALVVGVVVPTAVGLVLSWWLRRAEQAGRLRIWHYAFGARDYREAWDYVFGSQDGAYLLLTLAGDDSSRHFLAKYGQESWASQAPTRPQELYVEEIWPADAAGVVKLSDLERQPPRGMWISAEKIDRMEVLG
ncbi:MAG TPA: DUF6338 family protein [Solirubrobacterales bacterium]|jgi:hypothetical protein